MSSKRRFSDTLLHRPTLERAGLTIWRSGNDGLPETKRKEPVCGFFSCDKGSDPRVRMVVIGTSVWALVAWGIAQRVCSAFVRLACGALLVPVRFVNIMRRDIMRRGGFAAFQTNQGYTSTEYDRADHAAGDERPILSVLALLVADLVAGVGFTSLIRNILFPGPHLIERGCDVYAEAYHEQQDNVQSGEEVVEQFLSQIDRRQSRDDIFIASIRGLRNRGQVSAKLFQM